MLRRLFLILAGLLLILFGLRGPVLAVAGTDHTATVTAVKRAANQKVTDHNYTITYQFTAPGGQAVTGGFDRRNVYDATTLPRTGSSVRIRYLKAWPSYSAPASESGFTLMGLGAAGLGVLVLILGLTGGGAKTPRAHSAF